MKYCLSALILLLASKSAFAQKLNDSDSLKTFLFPEIVITATRTPISPKDSPSPVEVITGDDVRKMNAVTLADVLRSSGGVFLQEYGAQGALKTASFRGTSSQHLLVLLNGNRINNFQNNLVDFGLLPVGGIDRIEILRGGSSALYGADALGGVVNILTQETKNTTLRAEGSIGSYGYRRYFLEGGSRAGFLALLGGIGQEEGNDNYPFALRTPAGEIRGERLNASFLKRHLFLHAGMNYDQQSGSTVAAQIVKSTRGVPGSASFPTPLARQDDENVILTADYRDGHLGAMKFALRTAFTYGLQGYSDPDPAFPIAARYKNTSLSLNPEFQIIMSPENRFLVGGEFVEGTLHALEFGGTISRIQKSLYISNETLIEHDGGFADRLSIFGTIRYDGFSNRGSALSPKVGFNVRLLRKGDVRIRGSYGRNFHAPSFNDLYYPGFGNPLLKSERSTSADVGLLSELRIFGFRQSVELTYFHLDTKEKILFDLTVFLPRNIGRSTSSGIEFSYEAASANGLLGLGASYSLVNALNKTNPGDQAYGKQLLFIPKSSGKLWMWVDFGHWRATMAHTVVGRRYVTDDNDTFLDSFGILNVSLSCRLPLGIVKGYGTVEANNVFNKDYQVFPSYPMPQRTYRATVGMEF